MTIADQPPPKPNDQPAIWELVIEDMRQRDHVGRERYGTPLQPFNGRDALVDAYQEALDLVVYLRQAIHERDQRSGRIVFMHGGAARWEDENHAARPIVTTVDPGNSGTGGLTCSVCGAPVEMFLPDGTPLAFPTTPPKVRP